MVESQGVLPTKTVAGILLEFLCEQAAVTKQLKNKTAKK
jgi:hypothetical protein